MTARRLVEMGLILALVGALGCSETTAAGTRDGGEDAGDGSASDGDTQEGDGGEDTGDTDATSDSATTDDSETGSATDTAVDSDTASASDSASDSETGTGGCVDADSDDWCAPLDCNDTDSAINPDRPELPSGGVDEDCDGQTDELGSLEDWTMVLTVDNQFDVYFGTPTATTGTVVGGGTEWPVEYTFTAEDRLPSDYLYVATASDQLTAQGFIGTFTNLTRAKTTITGDPVWEVFAAGDHPETNPYWPAAWPPAQMPTQAQVDTAIAFAEAGAWWETPVGASGYDNDPLTLPTGSYTSPWSTVYPNIPAAAQWIWRESGDLFAGAMPSPLEGHDHGEFMVFRVAGKVELE